MARVLGAYDGDVRSQFLGGVLLTIGMAIFIMGVIALPHGSVSGGSIVWILFFGGAAVLICTGVQIIRK